MMEGRYSHQNVDFIASTSTSLEPTCTKYFQLITCSHPTAPPISLSLRAWYHRHYEDTGPYCTRYGHVPKRYYRQVLSSIPLPKGHYGRMVLTIVTQQSANLPRTIITVSTTKAIDKSDQEPSTIVPRKGIEETDDQTSESESNDDDVTEQMHNMPLSNNDQTKVLTDPVLHLLRMLETTLFDRLEKMYRPGIKRMLEIQYHMHKQICTFPSKTLYSSCLQSHESCLGGLAQHPAQAEQGHALGEEELQEVLSTPVVFFDMAGCEYVERQDTNRDGDKGSKCNNEALIMKNWVERLINVGVGPEQIAVIAPYVDSSCAVA
ncbi:hypothetical protein APHAL10511_008412 [Amanita phalloides]|nr:hypothetical protein APHAL10511_008412 [Amanita phalloides]